MGSTELFPRNLETYLCYRSSDPEGLTGIRDALIVYAGYATDAVLRYQMQVRHSDPVFVRLLGRFGWRCTFGATGYIKAMETKNLKEVPDV